jgi:hypothetical protein
MYRIEDAKVEDENQKMTLWRTYAS